MDHHASHIKAYQDAVVIHDAAVQHYNTAAEALSTANLHPTDYDFQQMRELRQQYSQAKSGVLVATIAKHSAEKKLRCLKEGIWSEGL
jgi:hypothetical protein